jgi:hypothetical protein
MLALLVGARSAQFQAVPFPALPPLVSPPIHPRLPRKLLQHCLHTACLLLAAVMHACAACAAQGGGVRVNNAKIDDELHAVGEGDLIEGRLLLIAAGKKNKMLVRVEA